MHRRFHNPLSTDRIPKDIYQSTLASQNHIPEGCLVGNNGTHTIHRYAFRRNAWYISDRSILRKKKGSHELLTLTCTLLSLLYLKACSDAELTRRSSGTWIGVSGHHLGYRPIVPSGTHQRRQRGWFRLGMRELQIGKLQIANWKLSTIPNL